MFQIELHQLLTDGRTFETRPNERLLDVLDVTDTKEITVNFRFCDRPFVDVQADIDCSDWETTFRLDVELR